jgi:adenylate kinase
MVQRILGRRVQQQASRAFAQTRGFASFQARALILGAPGSGKGTLSERLVKTFEFNHVSSGDALRQQIKEGTEVGKKAEGFIKAGDLVPDDVITKLVLGHVRTLPTSEPWLLDGFPRTPEQSKSLDAEFDINLVVNLDVPESEILSRLSNRRVHVGSGRTYHLVWNPPKKEGVDDVTGEPLLQRPDDTEEAIKERMLTYRKMTEPLIEHYRAKGVLQTYTGTESNVLWPLMEAGVKEFFAGKK